MTTVNKRSNSIAMIAGVVGVVLVAVGLTGWFMYHSKHTNTDAQNASKTANTVKVTSYDECLKAHGSATDDYQNPTKCMTASGQVFKNPSYTPPYLVISEWHVRLPLSAKDIVDAKYTLNTSQDMAHITTGALADAASKLSGCHRGVDDVYLSRSTTKPDTTANWSPKKIGDYYYSLGTIIEPDCESTSTDPSLITIRSIQGDLLTALPQVVAAP